VERNTVEAKPAKECGFKKEKKRGFSAVRLHAELFNALLAIRAREWKAVLRLVRIGVLTDPGQIIPSVPHVLVEDKFSAVPAMKRAQPEKA
jgi:hypothetical protein